MTRYAVVCDGSVTNVVLWDGVAEWDPGEGCSLLKLDDDSPVGPGWTRSRNNRWVAPAEVEAPVEAQALTVDPAALAAFVQAVTDPATDTRQVLADFAQALNPGSA